MSNSLDNSERSSPNGKKGFKWIGKRRASLSNSAPSLQLQSIAADIDEILKETAPSQRSRGSKSKTKEPRPRVTKSMSVRSLSSHGSGRKIPRAPSFRVQKGVGLNPSCTSSRQRWSGKSDVSSKITRASRSSASVTTSTTSSRRSSDSEQSIEETVPIQILCNTTTIDCKTVTDFLSTWDKAKRHVDFAECFTPSVKEALLHRIPSFATCSTQQFGEFLVSLLDYIVDFLGPDMDFVDFTDLRKMCSSQGFSPDLFIHLGPSTAAGVEPLLTQSQFNAKAQAAWIGVFEVIRRLMLRS